MEDGVSLVENSQAEAEGDAMVPRRYTLKPRQPSHHSLVREEDSLDTSAAMPSIVAPSWPGRGGTALAGFRTDDVR
jgi:hypothetical protein